MCESRFPLKSQWGGAALHYLTSTPSILAPSQGLMFYCHAAFAAALFNVAGSWGSVQNNKKKRRRLARWLTACSEFHFSLLPQQCHHTQQTALLQIAQASFETASSVSQFTLWVAERGGMWCVFVLLESPAGNVTPLSSCAALQLIGAVFVFSFQVSVSVAAFAPEFYK